eukprot:15470633-Alexandrium_andersonii.AAC.1
MEHARRPTPSTRSSGIRPRSCCCGSSPFGHCCRVQEARVEPHHMPEPCLGHPARTPRAVAWRLARIGATTQSAKVPEGVA